MIRQLVDVASKNGNYLLNVGPTSKGDIPEPAVERLQQVGAWLKLRGEAVYGVKPSPYPYEFNWGSVTAKDNRLYLNVVEWPAKGSFELYGLSNRVRKANVLGQKNSNLKFTQSKADGHDTLHLDFPSSAPNPDVSVIALDLDGAPNVNTGLVQQPDGTVTLNCALGKLPAETKLKVSNRGITSGWLTRLKLCNGIFNSIGREVISCSRALRRSAGRRMGHLVMGARQRTTGDDR